jgi:hypothetical protein
MPAPKQRLRRARERLGLEPQAVADSAGLDLPSYYDLETCDDELFTCIALRDLFNLCNVLRISPTNLFTDSPDEAPAERHGFPHLARCLRDHLASNHLSLDEFENRAGWSLSAFLDHPDTALDWNVDCLRAVCAQLNLNWLAYLSEPLP